VTDSRYAAGATVVSVGLAIAATVALLAASGFDAAALAHPGSIVDRGEGAADLLRVGGLLDMASYLPVAVLVLYLHDRLRRRGGQLVALMTAGGLAYVLIGGIGGAILATGGPPLIEGYATATESGREAARVALDTLGHIVLAGLFGTLELIPLAGWVIGIGWLLRREWPAFAALSAVVGLAAFASAVRTGLTGRTLIEVDGPLALVIAASLGLFIVWQLLLVARLWRRDLV
jgi:hypothetical protein